MIISAPSKVMRSTENHMLKQLEHYEVYNLKKQTLDKYTV